MVSPLSGTLSGPNKTLTAIDLKDSDKVKVVQENIAYYELELSHFQGAASQFHPPGPTRFERGTGA